MSAVLKRCEHCGGSKRITSAKLGGVRCPYCRPAKVVRISPRNMRDLLSAVDLRAREQMTNSSTIEPDTFKFPAIPTQLLTTHRVLERWGDDGSGLPSETPDAYRQAKAPPLDPSTYTEVERIINTSPHRVRSFVYDWWRSSNPVHIAGTKRRISRRQLSRMRVDILHAMKARFLQSRHVDLVALIRFIPE